MLRSRFYILIIDSIFSSFSESDELSPELVFGTTVSSVCSRFFSLGLGVTDLLPLVELVERERVTRRRLLTDRERRDRSLLADLPRSALLTFSALAKFLLLDLRDFSVWSHFFFWLISHFCYLSVLISVLAFFSFLTGSSSVSDDEPNKSTL